MCNEKSFICNRDTTKKLSKTIDWKKPINIEYKGSIYPAMVLGVIHQRNQRYTVYIVRPEDESFKELFFQRDGRFIGWFMTHHDEGMVKFRPSEDIEIEEYPVVIQEKPKKKWKLIIKILPEDGGKIRSETFFEYADTQREAINNCCSKLKESYVEIAIGECHD